MRVVRRARFDLTLLLTISLVAGACSDKGGPMDPGKGGAGGTDGTGGSSPPAQDTVVPPLTIEFRGLWIATVANIDWPSRAGLGADEQKAELIAILDRAAQIGMNAIILHVRPAADALYRSSLEPWGAMLTGTQGADPGYDPLQFAIDAAHARGLELHAWINPFRAGNSRDTLKLAATHVWNTKRNLVRVYGTNLWLDPGEPAAQQHSMNVIRDIVTRYDIDAIHADDYFYPYPQGTLTFDDDTTYAQYGGGMTRADWRRANIDRFVERLYKEVHAIKPTVRVGISPFGIWRPGNPPGVNGLDAYASIYADARKWLQEGWVDYLAPQLYWAISAPQQSFPALLDWWLAQNVKGRHVWPGLAAYRVQDGTASAFTLQEIPSQIQTARARNASGHALYNTTALFKRNSGQLSTLLDTDVYTDRSIVAPATWLDNTPPAMPTVTLGTSEATIGGAAADTRWWIIRKKTSSGWVVQQQFVTNRTIPLDSSVTRIVVNAADAAMNLSPPAAVQR